MTVNTASGLPDVAQIRRILQERLPELQARYGVRSLALFGSYVRGEPDGASDLDILVEYETPPDFFQFVELEDHLSQMLGVKVDLVMKSALRPHIGKQILAECIPV